MAAATVAEKFFGTENALANIYNARWFVALWVICAASAVIYIKNTKLRQNGVALLLHFAFFVILCGAFTSFLTSKRGYIHIRQGEILNYFLIPKANDETAREPLPFNIKLLMFSKTPLNIGDLENNKPAESGKQNGAFFSYLQIDGKTCCVWLNHIYKYQNYRFYQYEYDNDEMGVTLLVNRDPTGIAITYSGYLLLLVSAVWLLFKKLKWKRFLYLSATTALVWFFISQIKPMTPVLRSPMLAAHVSVIMVAYVLLLVIAVLSVVALLKKQKNSNLYNINSKLLFPAVFLLAIGIFTGAVWANISWGRYWGWDSKETWALITLIIYAIPFHKNTFSKFREQNFFHKYLFIAFLSVLMTFLGVSFLLGGMHSYL
jgi:cytochrome c biogenesis factor